MVLQWGMAEAENQVPSAENAELSKLGSLFEAWGSLEYSFHALSTAVHFSVYIFGI